MRELFREFERSAGDSLDAAEFERELGALPHPYAPPEGWILVAVLGKIPAGCLAARRIDARRCEFRRLYVRPVFRGAGLGGLLLKRAVERAREAAYREVVIEAMPRMRGARYLYEGLGFMPCAPYLGKPTPGADAYLLTL